MQDNKLNTNHNKLTSIIWSIADNLRGPYKPPQYRRVMLPLIVLARFDAILSKHTEAMKSAYDEERAKPEGKGLTGQLLEKKITQQLGSAREQALYNISGFNLNKLLADPDQITANLVSYIQGFSPKAKDIFDKFEFETEIQKLDEANRLYFIISEFVKDLRSAGLDLSPSSISNLQMGYVFEDLVRRFNEQANEEAGDHFTPREVINLMVNMIFEEDQDELIQSGIIRSIYDPTAGTGGMLSVSEKYLKDYNRNIHLALFGQEYNPESYAICCADLLIKDEPAENIIFGDTLGVLDSKDKGNGFVPHDGHQNRKFHYMFANPPYGVDWKIEKDYIEEEAKKGFNGRFGAGLPRINDGSLLFLQHMISKMHASPEEGGDGSRIAVVFNGSPMFTGDAGSGESNIRRWIIENDWLEAVVALPDQMFYNTGINTYIWIVSNKKSEQRKGKVQLIDATDHYQKMRKSLGSKRNELASEHIQELTKLFANFKDGDVSKLVKDKQGNNKVCSKIFSNQEFAYIKITVERPLRLSFQVTEERIAKLDEQSAFINLAKSRKLKDKEKIKAEVEKGQATQQAIKNMLLGMVNNMIYKDRAEFEKIFANHTKQAKLKISAGVKKAIFEVLSERDPEAEICKDSKGNWEADSQLRDTELVPLAKNISLPLPLDYSAEASLDKLLKLVKDDCEQYMQEEVLPHVADAWVDYSKTKVGYEIPLNRHFYVYEPPRPLEDIKAEIVDLEQEIMAMLGGLNA